MLSIDPSKRPRLAQVFTVLHGILILSLASYINPPPDSLYTPRMNIDRSFYGRSSRDLIKLRR
jgi:hypothetical protein